MRSWLQQQSWVLAADAPVHYDEGGWGNDHVDCHDHDHEHEPELEPGPEPEPELEPGPGPEHDDDDHVDVDDAIDDEPREWTG